MNQKNYKLFTIIIFIYVMCFYSCTNQSSSVFAPIPDSIYKKEKTLEIGVITETKNGSRNLPTGNLPVSLLPAWLTSFFDDGIEAIEKNDYYRGKYVFIVYNEGVNFSTLNKWTDSYSLTRDFSILAAERIENRMISSAVLYPDDEYGLFFETMVKKAYNTVYSGAVKEDTFWIKTTNNELEKYVFFVFISIDKMTMQSKINSMIAESIASVTVNNTQRIAINRLRQNFFEGF